MWLILGGLLILIAWSLWWLLGVPLWITLVITLVVVVGIGSLYLGRFIASRRAAAKLEKALADQGNQQANNARPERRAEIQELQKQLQQGIAALKTSKLGQGGKSGAAALYSMPWYMIVGPPGAGKTTALKHSGLVFPYGSSSGGGVRGVGGTRNCDWWFTNEAILLDTAGRYTTESDDRDEWLSFLQFLLRYRSKRPINGILIAISIADIIDANEQQLEITGKKLRARVDEVMTQLHMVVPVYVLFTKVDLIAGFNEFFGDLRKSDRSQAWGATIKLDIPKNEPGKLFEAEFDILLKTLHGRALKRIAGERSREAREKVFQFPIEFAGIKRNVAELLAYTFAVNAFQGTPIFRGFYFTSGTQEGRPLDRVLGRMGQAMGIRTDAGNQQAQPVIESKSYFLHDVFMNVVFPDGDLAARSAGEVRRRLLMRIAISGSALALACILAIPAVRSFLNNREFLTDTEARAKKAAVLDWEDGKPSSGKLPLLKPTRERLEEIDKYTSEGVPLKMGWWMYTGDRVYRPLLTLYATQMQKGFVNKVRDNLVDRLKAVTADPTKYIANRNALKMYLMLAQPEHLDIEWATGKYTALWTEILKGSSDVSDAALKDLIRPEVHYYFTLLKRSERGIEPIEENSDLVTQVRKTLQSVPVNQRYYAQFVDELKDEKYDEAGDNSLENLVFPPISLNSMFADRPKLKKIIQSKSYMDAKVNKYTEVDGPYTEKGHYVVLMKVKGAAELLKEEAWIVPLTREEDPEQIPQHIKRLADDYQATYIKEWNDFFTDLEVKSPTSTDEAVDIYTELRTTEYPYRRLLQSLRDNTQFKNANPLEGKDGLATKLNGKLNQELSSKAKGLRFQVDVRVINGVDTIIPNKFKSAVDFAESNGETDVYRYTEILTKLIETINTKKRSNAQLDIHTMNQELDDAIKQSQALLVNYDQEAKKLIEPMLLAPLTIATRANTVPTVTAPPSGSNAPPGTPPPPTINGWQMPKLPGRP